MNEGCSFAAPLIHSDIIPSPGEDGSSGKTSHTPGEGPFAPNDLTGERGWGVGRACLTLLGAKAG